jgi:hypothetical protein
MPKYQEYRIRRKSAQVQLIWDTFCNNLNLPEQSFELVCDSDPEWIIARFWLDARPNCDKGERKEKFVID